jgi:hypothetical protein
VPNSGEIVGAIKLNPDAAEDSNCSWNIKYCHRSWTLSCEMCARRHSTLARASRRRFIGVSEALPVMVVPATIYGGAGGIMTSSPGVASQGRGVIPPLPSSPSSGRRAGRGAQPQGRTRGEDLVMEARRRF